MEPLSANDPRMIGEFRLHSRLGAGGMGQVYLGFSPAGRAVAIKVIHSQFAADPEFLRRFSHEVTAARAVGGMYTAPVVDSSVTDNSPWLATAYVPGPPLAAVVGQVRRAARGGGLAARRRARRGAARGARRRGDPPRPQAGQRAARRRRAARDRLRHLPAVPRHAADVGGHGDRHPRLHVARAGEERGDRAGERHLLPRLRARVRGDGQPAVRGRQPGVGPVPDRLGRAGPERDPAAAAPGHRGLPEEGPRAAAGPGPGDLHDQRPRPGDASHARLVLARGGGPRHRRGAVQPDPGRAHPAGTGARALPWGQRATGAAGAGRHVRVHRHGARRRAERTPTALATPPPARAEAPRATRRCCPTATRRPRRRAGPGRPRPRPARRSRRCRRPRSRTPGRSRTQRRAVRRRGPQPYGRARRPYGQTVFGQPGLGPAGTRAGPPYPGQAASYPGQAPSYPGQAPARTRRHRVPSSRAARTRCPGTSPGAASRCRRRFRRRCTPRSG